MLLKICTSIFVIIILSACILEESNSNGPIIYTNTLTDITFTFPDYWSLNRNYETEHATFDLIATGIRKDGFRPSVLILNNYHTGLKNVTEISIYEAIETFRNNPDITNFKDTSYVKSGIDVEEMMYSSPTSKGEIMISHHLYIIKNNNEVQITFSDLEKNFDNNTDIKMIYESITFN